jgi:ketosteroid isomerase-like protein
MYHPDSSIVEVDQVHGSTTIARGADAIRKTMAAYIDMKPHMDVVTHHTTVSGDFAMTRSQWLIRGHDKDGNPRMCIITAWKCTENCRMEPGYSSSTIPLAPIPNGP